MAQQLDMTRRVLGEKAYRKHVEKELRTIALRIVEGAGGKAVAAACGTTKSAISMACSGAGDRGLQVGWLLGLDTFDHDRELGEAIVRLVYDAELCPLAQRTPEQERDAALEELRKFGEPGRAALKRIGLK